MAIDRGRWYDIAQENRMYHMIICNCNEIGDGFQYLFHSTDITIKEILTTFICITLYSFTKPNVSKLKQIFKTNKNIVDLYTIKELRNSKLTLSVNCQFY